MYCFIDRYSDHGSQLGAPTKLCVLGTYTAEYSGANLDLERRPFLFGDCSCGLLDKREVITVNRTVTFDAVPRRLLISLDSLIDAGGEILNGCIILGFTKDGAHLGLMSAACCLLQTDDASFSSVVQL